MAAKKNKSVLKSEKRKQTGRKVKKLRQEGFLPANIYGKKVKSQAVKVDLKTFLSLYQSVGETGVVDLSLKGETKTRPVLINNVQLDPVTDRPLHVDFYQVSLKEKVTTEIPIELVSESPAVKEKIGILVQQLSEIEVEALPTQLPDKFSVDIGRLKAVDDAVAVGELKAPSGVKILTAPKTVIVKIELPTKEEAPPEEKPSAEAEGEEETAEEGKDEVGEDKKDQDAKPDEKGGPLKGSTDSKETEAAKK